MDALLYSFEWENFELIKLITELIPSLKTQYKSTYKNFLPNFASRFRSRINSYPYPLNKYDIEIFKYSINSLHFLITLMAKTKLHLKITFYLL